MDLGEGVSGPKAKKSPKSLEKVSRGRSPRSTEPQVWCIKILLPWAQKFYTPLVLGRGSKCPWQFFPPAGPEKAHKHLAHKQFLGHPGQRLSLPGTQILPAGCPDANVYVPWVPHTAHKLLTPGHRETPGHPVGRPPPPPTRAVTGKICLCLPPVFKLLRN